MIYIIFLKLYLLITLSDSNQDLFLQQSTAGQIEQRQDTQQITVTHKQI